MPRIVQWIWIALGLHLVLGFAAYLHYSATGNYHYLGLYFWILGTLFFLLMTGAESFLAFECRAGFDADEPMRLAWTFIALASLSRFAGTALIAANDWHLTWITGQTSSSLALVSLQGLSQTGAVVGGPLSMIFLVVGLSRVLKIQRMFGVLSRLTRMDQLLIGLIAVFTLGQVFNIAQHIAQRPSLSTVFLWLSDPLLALLLVEAVLIRRSAIRVGMGLISQCWSMYVIAIVTTSTGDASLWTASEGLLSPALTALSWYIWFFAAAAYASAPAYQLAAMSLPLAQESAAHKRN
jgi:uncharacterized membrane protein YuzA (DUF378 family)